MSKKKSKKKVVVKTTSPTTQNTGKTVVTKKTLKPTVSKGRASSASSVKKAPLLFGKQNYFLMLAGILLIAIGYVLMAGGAMPSPDVWDESIIYSTRRTVLAPIFILAGLGLEIYAIFKR